MRRKKSGLLRKFLGPNVMSALQVWLWLLIFIFQNSIQDISAAEPGYLDFDNLPETNFSCAGKVIGGYYADLETDCQMFHVCTIGQLEEPMDIKFLCLNGTVFDQETRVCERVDEVDCSKSEHFYSLNLELYGNTAPPIIKAETSTKKDDNESEEEEEVEEDYDGDYEDPTSTTKATTALTTTMTTTTKKPTTKSTTTQKPTYHYTTVQTYHYDPSSDTEIDAYDLIEDNESKEPPTHSNNKNNTRDYHDSNYQYDTDSQVQKPSNNDQNKYDEYDVEEDGDKSTDVDNNSQGFNTQDFVYHHSNPHELVNKNSPAISFQQQSFSSDGKNSHVTVTTHTGKEQYAADIMKVNNANKNIQLSRTYLASSTPQSDSKSQNDKPHNYNPNYPGFETPNRTPLIPTPPAKNLPPTGHTGLSKPKQTEPLYFSFRKPLLTPQGFKPNPVNSNVRLNQKTIIKAPAKPFQSYQPSERHEVSVNTEFDFEKLSPPYPQDYSQYHYEHKRSQDSDKYEASEESEKPDSVTLTSTPYVNLWSTRSTNQTKSLPRVIVTASASVSDSNGKKLNYTVGNILHAVKPLIPTNYDDYKEADVLLDPFFLDVPKLKKSRTKRSSKKVKSSKKLKREKRNQVFLLDANEYKMKLIETTTVKVSTKIDLPVNKKSTTIPSVIGQNKYYNQGGSYNHKTFTYPTTARTTTRWVPPDYVDDNYEPLTYLEPSRNEKHPAHTTTISNLAKTTLDVAKLETTTAGFIDVIANINSHKKGVQNYKLLNVHTITLTSDSVSDNNNSVKFTCSGKKYYKFYPDKTNCRTFHMCSPGLEADQVLDIMFNCDIGTFYNSVAVKCVSEKPNDCEKLDGL